jgi:proteasome lid subunit RPN8/RPN11
MQLLDKAQYNYFLREARRVARISSGTEICGLIVNIGFYLSFVQTRNLSRHAGSFVLCGSDVRRIVSSVNNLKQEVVGTFHSHPAATATPGKSDIEHAVDDSLMFVFDCIANEGRLWKIKKGTAKPVSFGFLQNVKFPSRPSHNPK